MQHLRTLLASLLFIFGLTHFPPLLPEEPPTLSTPLQQKDAPTLNQATDAIESTDSIEILEDDDLEEDNIPTSLVEDMSDTVNEDEASISEETAPALQEDDDAIEDSFADEDKVDDTDELIERAEDKNLLLDEQEEDTTFTQKEPEDELLEDENIDLEIDEYESVETASDPLDKDVEEAEEDEQVKVLAEVEEETSDIPVTIDPTLADNDEESDPFLDDDDDDDEDDITDEELGEDAELLDGEDPDDADAEAALFADDDDADPEEEDDDIIIDDEDIAPDDDEEDQNTTASDEIAEDDSFFDDGDLEDEEKGTFDPKTGAKLSHALFGDLVFAPSPEAIADNTAKPIGDATNRVLELTKQTGTASASITKTRLQVTNLGNLSITGVFNANNHKGKLKLKSFTDGEMIFTVEFPQAFPIQITPDRIVKVKNFKLSVSDTGDVEFFTKKFVFLKRPENYDPEDEEEDTTIKFGITAEDATAEATAEELPLYKLMPSAKDKKDLKKIMLEELVFNIANPFSSKPPPAEITIECTAKLDHIKLWGKAHLSNSTCDITMDRNSVELSCQGDTPIVFDDAMTLEKPLVEIEAIKGEKPEFTIGGTLSCNFPVVGRMRLPIQGEKRDDGITLKGKIEKKIGFGPIKFGDPEVVLTTSDGTASEEGGDDTGESGTSKEASKPKRQKKIEIMGTGKFFGLGIKPIMRIIKPADGSKRKISFSGKFDAPNLNPLSKIPGLKSIPGLGSFKIPDAFLGMSSAKKFFIGGSAKLFGIVGKVKVIPKDKIVDLMSDKPWRLSDTIPGAKGTVFDAVILNNIRFAAAAKEGYDDATDTPIRKGVNAFGSLDTSQGMFANLRKIMGGALPKTVTASIVINPNPRHCKYVIMLPFDVKLSSKAILHGISFEISGEPSVALMLTLKFMPSKSDPPLLFTARIEFELIGCALSATMAGFWHHPFGIKGLHVGDLAIEAKLPYAIPPIPIAFGIAGTMQIGEFLLKVAVKLGADDIILLAEVSKLPLFFWIDLIKLVGMDLGPLEILKAIDIYLEDVKFKFAPTGGQIGTLMFEPGISGQGRLNVKVPGIIDTYAEAGFNLNIPNGFKLYAYMPELELGPLKITGKGPDMKYGTKDDGAILRVVLGLLEQRIFMSARAECLGSEGEVEVDIKLTSVKFKMLMKFLGILEAKVLGESYRKGLRLGFRVMSLFKLGRSTMKMVGDFNTYGYMLGSRIDSLTIRDIAAIAKIPEEIIPDIGFKDVESYVRFMPGQLIEDAVKPTVNKIAANIKDDFDELRGDIKEVADEMNEITEETEDTVKAGMIALEQEAAKAEAEQRAAAAA